MKRSLAASLFGLAAVLAGLAAGGCGPLLGVRATVRTDERTRLEEQVLGERAGPGPGQALLPLEGEATTADELGELEALGERLAALPAHDAESRAWQAVVLHNRAVLEARRGARGAARALLAEAAEHAALYGLATLQWQVRFSAAQLAEGQEAAARLDEAARILLESPPIGQMDYDFEDPARRCRLYAALAGAALEAGDPAGALARCAEREAVALARATPPGALTFPPGELSRLAAELAAARQTASKAREQLCRLSPGGIAAEAPEPAVIAFREAMARLRQVAAGSRGSSAGAGLLVPDPAELAAVRELLGPEAVLVALEPLGGEDYAAFLLGSEAFRAERVTLPPASALAPFADELGAARRLYLSLPPSLSGLAWQQAPLDGAPLAERLEVVFTGGLSDLYWAFETKGYGRNSVLIVGGWPGGLGRARSLVGEGAEAEVLDVREHGKGRLGEAAELRDVLWLLNPLELAPGAPWRSRLAWPGELALLSGVSPGEWAVYRTRASCAAFAGAPDDAFSSRSFDALRVLTRALVAAGVPSVVYGTGAERLPAAGEPYWRAFMGGVLEGSAAAAHREALAALAAAHRGAFRLYGFGGLSEEAYREYGALEFSDRARAGNAHLAAGRYAEAAGAFLDLWHMARAVQFESEAAQARVLAQIQQQLVQCFRALGDYGAAVRHQRLLIEQVGAFEGGEGPLTVVAYQSLGAVLTEAERFGEAAEAYRSSVELLRELGEREDMARVLGELGKSLDRAAEYEGALETFRRALDEYRELGRPGGMARQHGRIGAVELRRLNNAPRAEEHLLEALRLYREAGDEEGVTASQIDLGLSRRAMGDLEGALERFELALRRAAERKQPRLRARALAELGNTRWLRGEYEAALGLVGRSNELAEEIGDAFRLNVNYQLLGLIHWELNDDDRAIRALERAIAEARRAADPLEVASAHNNLGIVHRRRGDYAAALAEFARAVEIDTRLGSRWGLGYDHRNIGITLHRMERHGEASPHLELAVELAREIGDRVNLARALLALGELRLDQGRLREAEPLLGGALGGAREVYLPEVEWRALRGLGRLERARGEQEAALERFREGIEVVEGLRGEIKVAEFQSSFLTNKMELYEDAVGLLLEMGHPEEAFRYAERSRARRFMDVLAGREFELRTPRERELYGRLEELARRMRALREALGREEDEERRSDLAEGLQAHETDYSDLLVEIRAANPGLSAFVSVEAAGADELGDVLGPGTALLAYYMLPQELVVWVFRDGRVGVRRTPVERDALSERIRGYRIMVQNRELLEEVLAASRELDAVLVEPVRDLIEGSEAIGIVPHRALHYLSFASLHDGEGYLVEEFPLFYGPSASALARTLRQEPPGAREGLRVLAVGNPAVGEPAYELPFTEQEVVSIARDFVEVTMLTGERATEGWVTENIGGFDVVHVGAHGRFDPLNPLFSSLMLAPGDDDDGLLHLHEVTGLRIEARLVTLSACQSGVGELRSGDDLVSLARAFTYAGTRAILSTLWRVDDVSTALVTKHFYRRYVDHGAATSLRHAQLQVMRDGRHAHPTYWAGVVLSGDHR